MCRIPRRAGRDPLDASRELRPRSGRCGRPRPSQHHRRQRWSSSPQQQQWQCWVAVGGVSVGSPSRAWPSLFWNPFAGAPRERMLVCIGLGWCAVSCSSVSRSLAQHAVFFLTDCFAGALGGFIVGELRSQGGRSFRGFMYHARSVLSARTPVRPLPLPVGMMRRAQGRGATAASAC